MYVDIYETSRKYSIIYADPPWQYHNNHCNGACENHYKTMSLEEICCLPIKKISADDCVLFLWVTYPMLKDGLTVMEAWGFKYKTLGFQWVKLNKSGKGYFFGLGYWTRSNTECCLLGMKGHPKRYGKSVSQLVVEPISRHSKKPDTVRDKILELCGDKPRLELFARADTKGWDVWGDEVEDAFLLS